MDSLKGCLKKRVETSLLAVFFLLLGGMVPVHAQLILTFSDNGDNRTRVEASGGTATAASNDLRFAVNSLGIYSSGDEGFRGVDTSFDFSSFAPIGFGLFDDELELVNGSGLSNGRITSFNFNPAQFGLLLGATAMDGETLSAIGAPDPTGIMPVNYDVFTALFGQTITNTQDNFSFFFTIPITPLSPAVTQTDITPLLAIQSALFTGVFLPNAHSSSLREFERTALNTLHNRRIIRARSTLSNPKVENDSLATADRHVGRYLNFARVEGLSLRQALGLEDIPVSHTESRGSSSGIASTLEQTFSIEQPIGGTFATEPKRWEVYAEGDVGVFDGDALNSVNRGFDSRTEIGSVGVEYLVSPSLVMGAAYTFGENETDLNAGLGNVDIEGSLYSVYATTYRNGMYLDALYSYGDFENKLVRNTGVAGLATGTPDSDSHTFSINGGKNIEVGGLITGPTLGFDYISGKIDAYVETGGGFANLSYASRNYESAVSSLGWQVSKTRSTSGGQMTLQGFTSWDHEFEAESGNVQAGLVNFPGIFQMNQSGAAPGTDWMVLGGALRFKTDTGWSFEVDYQTQLFREDAQVHYFGGRISAVF
ncbi:MAG: autotransporter outer membrane beta-barrel domain-containing protein [Verrucomicrobiota bacterium]